MPLKVGRPARAYVTEPEMQPTSYDGTRRGKAWEGEILPFSKERIRNRKGRAEMQTGRSQGERGRRREKEQK